MAISYQLQSLQARLKKLEQQNRGIESLPLFSFHAYGAALEIQTDIESEVVIAGAAGTGKSTACLAKIHKTCMDNPHVRALIVRKTRASLAETALHTFEGQILGPGHPMLAGPTRQNRKTYQYPNGSRINVGGMDNPSRIMSSDYDIIFVQEATELTEEDWDNLLSRLRNYQLPFQQLMGDCNPQAENHWLYKRFERGALKLLKAQHEDNPMLWSPETGWTQKGEEYLKKLDNLSGVRYKRLRLGLWAAAEGAVYEDYDPQTHIFHGHLPIFQKYIVGMDFGHRNAGVMLTFGQTHNGDLFLVDEVYMTGQTIDWWTEQLQAVMIKYKPEKVLCDPARPEIIQAFSLKGIPAMKGNNRIKFGVDLIQQRLKNRTIKFFHNSLKNPDRNLKDNLMPMRLTDEILGYVWDEKKENPVATQNHALDAMRYVVTFVDKPMSVSAPATSTSVPMFQNNKGFKVKMS